MEDTVNSKTLAVEIAKAIEEHKGLDTVALYLGERCSFTDCFVITTVTSSGHLRGLYKNLRELLASRGVALAHKKKALDDEGWVLLDCGTLVIHIMTKEKRDFYDLERLWFEAEALYHSSSKSS